MEYWIIVDNQRVGPLSFEQLRLYPITGETLVWHPGLPTWRQARFFTELTDLIAGTLPANINPYETTQDSSPESHSHDLTPDEQAIALDAQTEEANDADVAPKPLPQANVAPVGTPIYSYQPVAPISADETPLSSSRQRPPKPNTYLAWSILSLICCCLPAGIVALIYSSKVSSLYDRGDYEAAVRASEKAELWLIIAITLGIVLAPFQIFIAAL